MGCGMKTKGRECVRCSSNEMKIEKSLLALVNKKIVGDIGKRSEDGCSGSESADTFYF